MDSSPVPSPVEITSAWRTLVARRPSPVHGGERRFATALVSTTAYTVRLLRGMWLLRRHGVRLGERS
jgi:hypothetical protein